MKNRPFHENPQATLKQLRGHKETLEMCQQTQDIKNNIEGTNNRITQLIKEDRQADTLTLQEQLRDETNQLGRSGAT